MVRRGADPDFRSRVLTQFDNSADVWPKDNAWSNHTRSQIAQLLKRYVADIREVSQITRILNIGSHGNEYEIGVAEHVHVDLSANALAGLNLAAAGDAESLPFANRSFDAAVCVGSVINYCSPPRVFSEIGRVLKPAGHLLLEYETSESLEFIMTDDFRKDVTLVDTFYNCANDKIYVYSSRYIESALLAAGFSMRAQERFHTISPLMFRLTRNERLSAFFARLDRTVGNLRSLQRYSANIFVLAEVRNE